MAEFSKQYCELHDMGFDGDFDVYEEWAKLTPGFSIAYICEGFGFSVIARPEHSDTVLVYIRNWDDDSKSKWVDFDEMVLAAK
jgi:hypothetical protein